MTITITKSAAELYTLTSNFGQPLTASWDDLMLQIGWLPQRLLVAVKKQLDACGWATINAMG
ncbi:MAG: hypothetical protein WAM04_10835 [Candidatus Sulfotelmatobacter sp.]